MDELGEETRSVRCLPKEDSVRERGRNEGDGERGRAEEVSGRERSVGEGGVSG